MPRARPAGNLGIRARCGIPHGAMVSRAPHTRSSTLLAALTALAPLAGLGCSKSAPSSSSGSSGSGAEVVVVAPGEDAGPSTEPATVPKPEGGKLASRAMETWVFEGPSQNSRRLGYLRAGAIVDTRGGIAGREGCSGGWVPIAPQGFVCVGPTATGNLDDAIVKASQRRAELGAGLPYGYAVVRTSHAPFYTRLPSEAESKALESDWDKHFRTLTDAEAEEARDGEYPQLSSVPGGTFPFEPAPGVLAAWATDGKDDPIPDYLADSKTTLNLSGLVFSRKPDADGGSPCPAGAAACIPLDAARPMRRLGISFIASMLHGKRRFLLTPELLLMPADRVRLVRGTSFQGVELSKDGPLSLPMIFVTKAGAKRQTLDGNHLKAGAVLPWRSAHKVEKKIKLIGGEHYHVLADGSLVSSKESVRLDPIRKLPKWGKEGERWLEINLTKQTLLAVEGDTPVFATLVSTGAGGMSTDTEKNPYVTPRGIYRVHTKHTASTMDSRVPEAAFELRDVPYIQYFQDGYALHAAYWHDQFGLPRSHGCINLAPKDAARIFAFTKPELPPGWHGVMLPLRGTVVWIHN